jgi:hypothetical protein
VAAIGRRGNVNRGEERVGMESWNEFPWATFTVVFVTFVASVVGAGVVIWGDEGALSFEQYLDLLTKFAIGNGILAVGRGVRSGLLKHGTRRT